MKRAVRIFLSYAREDERRVEKLYQKLSDAGVKPWMDKKDILAGEVWENSIQRAIRRSDFFLACLSANSVSKRGFLQKEIREALDIWQEKLEDDIYLIPVRLEACEAPESLRKFQWVDLFEENGWTRLVEAIQVGMERWGEVPADAEPIGKLLLEDSESRAALDKSLGLKKTEEEVLPPEDNRLASPGVRRRWRFVISLIMVGAVVVAAIAFYLWVSKYSSFASDFTPASIGIAASNAENDNYVAQNPNVPEPLTWYELKSGGLITSTAVQIDYSRLDHYLYYSSLLSTKEYSWTGFFFWRTFPLPELNASGKSELIAIIYAEKPDTLEIGFRDVHGNEKKIALKVVEGWAGYRVPLTEFAVVDFNRIDLFLIAHSRGVGSNDANVFKLALLGLR